MKRRMENLKRLLRPRHVAFVGGSGVEEAVRQCEAIGFSGPIWVVNPNHRRLAGRLCYRSVSALPEPPDATFIVLSGERSIPVVRALAEAGAAGCVCYAAGFGEIGSIGKTLERKLVAAAGEMALVGPNCYGILNYVDGVALWPAPHGGKRVEGGVALISQSGNIALNLTMNDRSLPISHVVSVGNQAVLGISDYVDALSADPRVSAIGIYLEGLDDVSAFSRAASTALERGVPIVALKAGRSDLGAQLTLSHTSSLAGSQELYDALFERLGIVQVKSIPSLVETLKLLSISGIAPGSTLGVLTCSGGDSALVADLAGEEGLHIPPLSGHIAERIQEYLPGFASSSNPLDYNTSLWGDKEGLTRCFSTFMDDRFDAVLLVLDYPRPGVGGREAWHIAVDAFIAARVKKTGITAAVVSTLPELLPAEARRRFAEYGIAPLQGLREAMGALGASAWLRERRATMGSSASASLALPEVEPPLASDPVVLDEWESKGALEEYGLRVPRGRVEPLKDVGSAAEEIGFPVAVKAVSADLSHKTELGAVALGLESASAAQEAAKRIAGAVSGHVSKEPWFLIEQMISDPVCELIVGVKRDPQFGLALVVGSGGILVNLVGDAKTLLLPTDRVAVEEALGSLRVSHLLHGYRGRPAGDRSAAVDAIMSVAFFAEAHRDQLVELDVNPLLVLPAGHGAVAVDVLICLRPSLPSIAPATGSAKQEADDEVMALAWPADLKV